MCRSGGWAPLFLTLVHASTRHRTQDGVVIREVTQASLLAEHLPARVQTCIVFGACRSYLPGLVQRPMCVAACACMFTLADPGAYPAALPLLLLPQVADMVMGALGVPFEIANKYEVKQLPAGVKAASDFNQQNTWLPSKEEIKALPEVSGALYTIRARWCVRCAGSLIERTAVRGALRRLD